MEQQFGLCLSLSKAETINQNKRWDGPYLLPLGVRSKSRVEFTKQALGLLPWKTIMKYVWYFNVLPGAKITAYNLS